LPVGRSCDDLDRPGRGGGGAGRIRAYLIYTSSAFGWKGRAPGLSNQSRKPGWSLRAWMVQAGIGEVSIREAVGATGLLFVIGTIGGYVLFGGILPALVAGLFAGCFPLSWYRARRRSHMAAAAESWPRMLEELRLRAGSLGHSVPQALFETGRNAPAEWRPAFAAAEREWLLTTDFPRTVALLKEALADPTVDAVGETLLVAHEVGGGELDARLVDLIEDRVLDIQGRRDAQSRQAGVRFARRFVLLVPLGMALAGLTIGAGRSAYQTAGGQLAVVVGLAAVLLCWLWSGRLMQLPSEPRVFR
jgi:tight adherence protein B